MTRMRNSMLLAVLLTGCFSLVNTLAGEAIEGSAKADKLEHCVEPTSVMRRNHFEFIKHQRDITVHQGVRGSKYSLAGCIDCHVRRDAQGKAVPVNAPGEKCQGCHEYAAVSIDCFSCHSAVPREK